MKEQAQPKDGAEEPWSMEGLSELDLPLEVSLGCSEMPLGDVMGLQAGSVVELDASADDPVTILVNNNPIAKGDLIIVDGRYGVRILEIGTPAERLRSLG